MAHNKVENPVREQILTIDGVVFRFVGEGTYNSAYVTDNEIDFKGYKGHWVLKIPKTAEALSSVDRAIRLWERLNPQYPAARVGNGWLVPYFGATQASDEQIEGKVIEIYARTGTIVGDAFVKNNFLFHKGEVVCIDVDLAWRRNSTVSDTYLNDLEYQECGLRESMESYHRPRTIAVIRALLFLDKHLAPHNIKKEYITSPVLGIVHEFYNSQEPITVVEMDTLVIMTTQYLSSPPLLSIVTPQFVKKWVELNKRSHLTPALVAGLVHEQLLGLAQTGRISEEAFLEGARFVIHHNRALIDKTIHGVTLLHQAVIGRHNEAAALLLNQGADTTTTTTVELVDHTVPQYPNMTAADIALCSINEELVTLLAPYNAPVSRAFCKLLTGFETSEALNLTNPNNPVVQLRKELISLAKNSARITDAKQEDLLRFILQHNHFLTWPLNTEGDTFLHFTFRANNERVIRQLTSLPNWATLCQIKNSITHWTLLHTVVRKGGLDHLYRYLTTVPKDARTKRGKSSALHMAAALQDSRMCVALMNDGADIDLKDRDGQRPQDIWGKSTSNPVMNFRSELYSLAVNKSLLSARRAELIRLILNYPHLLTRPLNADGAIFLEIALKHNRDLFCKIMCDFATNTAVCSGSKKARLLRLILVVTDYSDEPLFLKEPLDRDQRTFLHVSLDANNTMVLKELDRYVNWKPLLRITDRKGRTFLHLAARYGHAHLCTLLMQQGALAFELDRGKTAERIWGAHHPSQENPITPYLQRAQRLSERKKTIITNLDFEIRNISRLLRDSFLTNQLLSDLRKRINDITFNPMDPLDKTEENVLREAIETWEQQNCSDKPAPPGIFYAVNMAQVKRVMRNLKDSLSVEPVQQSAADLAHSFA